MWPGLAVGNPAGFTRTSDAERAVSGRSGSVAGVQPTVLDIRFYQGEVGTQNALLKPMKDAIANGRASPAETEAFCLQLDDQIARVQRLTEERSRYIAAQCDQFDWFNRGSKEAARLERHQWQLEQDKAQLHNLIEFRNRYCR